MMDLCQYTRLHRRHISMPALQWSPIPQLNTTSAATDTVTHLDWGFLIRRSGADNRINLCNDPICRRHLHRGYN